MTVYNCSSQKYLKPAQSFLVRRLRSVQRIDHNYFASVRIDCDQVPVATTVRIVDWEQDHVKAFGSLISRDAFFPDLNVE